ncbi:MAG: bacteriohemerythrin [Deferrisomatales bacterium]
MSSFSWREEYRLGVAEMDHQHRELFGRLEALERAAVTTGGPEPIRECLDAVHEDAAHHFDREEQLLAAAGFPGLVQQRVQHREFLRRVRAAAASSEAGKVPLETAHRLQNWMLGHVVGLDREYAAFLAAALAEGRPEGRRG